MIEKIKLKHLDLFMQDEIDYLFFMKELMDYEHKWWKKKSRTQKVFNKTFLIIEEVKAIEPKQVLLNPDFKIRYPENIDSISFSAMISVNGLMNNAENLSIAEAMASVIAMVCYSENNSGDFIKSGFKMKSFKNRILNSSALNCMGLFNHIVKQLDDSNAFWEKLFFDVEVSDLDYDNAGGSKMKSFNVINTIKNICADFNYSEERAWQVPYALTQTNSLAKATQAWVRDNMRKIKEDRMKYQRKQ